VKWIAQYAGLSYRNHRIYNDAVFGMVIAVTRVGAFVSKVALRRWVVRLEPLELAAEVQI
jgi:hypothetical protein